MSSKAETLAALEAGYSLFRASIADLDDDAYSEPWLGSWDLAHCLAHMAGWYREITGSIARVGRGERPTPGGVDYADTDGWNERLTSDAKQGRDALRDWDEAYRAYYDAGATLPESLFGIDPEKGKPRIGVRLLDGAGIHHFAEHQPQLDAWLASRRGR